MANGVRTVHPQYKEYAPLWERCEDAAEGESDIHEAGVKYLPKLAGELPEDYEKRKNRTSFFNATWRTIAALRGMLLRKPPTVETPAAIEPYLDDVDMAGTSLYAFAQDVIEDCLITGRIGVLVDHPPAPDTGMTVAQAEAYGMRPKLCAYDADEIINWKMSRINNAMQLSLVVLEESAPLQGDEFAHECEDRYRVLDLIDGVYRQRVFRINERGDDELIEEFHPMMNGKTMGFIPFVFIGADESGADCEVPPLMDLVDMNLKHYAVSADYEHACHYSGLPTLFVTGHCPNDTDPAIYIGGPSANCLPDPQAKAYFVETQGDFPALRTNLEDKKAQMAVLGARMLEGQHKGVESAETVARRTSGEQSLLSAMAMTISGGIERCLEIMAMWSNAPGTVRFELNRDFTPVGMTFQDLSARVAAWQSGAISHQELYAQLVQGEVIAQDATFEEMQAQIGDTAPTAP